MEYNDGSLVYFVYFFLDWIFWLVSYILIGLFVFVFNCRGIFCIFFFRYILIDIMYVMYYVNLLLKKYVLWYYYCVDFEVFV